MEVGLALGAGGPKGFAHIGVLRVLEENAVPVDYIAGCSIGAIVGAGYAAGWSLADIEKVLQGADRKVVRWTLPFRSIWSDAGLKEILRGSSATLRFGDLDTPFAAVATDVATGREVILREGLVWRALQASASIPGIFPPVLLSGRYLVDGGLVDPVPSHTVREMGARIVVAVDLMSSGPRAHENSGPPEISISGPATRVPNLVEMLWRSTEIMQEEVAVRSAATADVTIQPKVGRSRWSDFSRRGQSFIAAGEQAARDALPELRRLLPSLAPLSGPGGSGQ
jgi:NTE family protein